MQDRKARTIACSVENVYDQQVAMIGPAAPLPHWPITRQNAELRFSMTAPDGRPLLHFTRFGGKVGQWERQILQVNDPHGRDLGRLRPTAPVAQFSHINGYTLGLETTQQWLGVTEVPAGTSLREPKDPAPVFDHAGALIARIHRQRLHAGDSGQHRMYFSDYLLDCPQPLPQPLPPLLLAAAFIQHLYDQLPQGTWQAMFPW